MEQSFYSNGKLLLTGEYMVLDGALALALPTKFGQSLTVKEGNNQEIKWISYDHDGSIWFEGIIPFKSIQNKTHSNNTNSVKNTLIDILHQAHVLNPDFLHRSKGYEISTRLTFPKFWGLGTSSTLINNIAQWLQVDAYSLLKNSFGGSGYDIACAQHNTPILYHLEANQPVVKPVVFNPSFKNQIYFVYLNKKQSSKNAIFSYYNKQNDLQQTIPAISKLTQQILEVGEAKDFAQLLQKHEIEMSNVLEMETVQEALFPDFKGVLKSLGAWGGDFMLSISKENPTTYFKEKGYTVVIPYQEMIL